MEGKGSHMLQPSLAIIIIFVSQTTYSTEIRQVEGCRADGNMTLVCPSQHVIQIQSSVLIGNNRNRKYCERKGPCTTTRLRDHPTLAEQQTQCDGHRECSVGVVDARCYTEGGRNYSVHFQSINYTCGLVPTTSPMRMSTVETTTGKAASETSTDQTNNAVTVSTNELIREGGCPANNGLIGGVVAGVGSLCLAIAVVAGLVIYLRHKREWKSTSETSELDAPREISQTQHTTETSNGTYENVGHGDSVYYNDFVGQAQNDGGGPGTDGDVTSSGAYSALEVGSRAPDHPGIYADLVGGNGNGVISNAV